MPLDTQEGSADTRTGRVDQENWHWFLYHLLLKVGDHIIVVGLDVIARKLKACLRRRVRVVKTRKGWSGEFHHYWSIVRDVEPVRTLINTQVIWAHVCRNFYKQMINIADF